MRIPNTSQLQKGYEKNDRLKEPKKPQSDGSIMETKSDKVTERWGRKFKIVKNGLDEREVFSFIESLIEQNNEGKNNLPRLEQVIISLKSSMSMKYLIPKQQKHLGLHMKDR